MQSVSSCGSSLKESSLCGAAPAGVCRMPGLSAKAQGLDPACSSGKQPQPSFLRDRCHRVLEFIFHWKL